MDNQLLRRNNLVSYRLVITLLLKRNGAFVLSSFVNKLTKTILRHQKKRTVGLETAIHNKLRQFGYFRQSLASLCVNEAFRDTVNTTRTLVNL